MLYLVHHGEAVGPEVDPMRPLSDRGRAEIDLLAQSAAARGVMPAVMPHLPRLLGRLLSGDPEAGPRAFPLNGIVALEEAGGKWVERWRMAPESRI